MKLSSWLKLSVLFVFIFNLLTLPTTAQTEQSDFTEYATAVKNKKSKLTVSENVLDKYLLDTGVPPEHISTIPLSAKKTLYASQAKFNSVKRTTDSIVESAPDSKIGSQNNMLKSSNTWDAYVYDFSAPSPQPGTVALILMYSWTWDNDPNYAMSDQFGLAWTDDFNAITSIAEYEYTASGSNTWTGPCSDTLGGYGYQKYEPGAGIGWKINLFDSDLGPCQYNEHSGYGIVTIVKQHNNSGTIDVTSAVGTYFHQYITLNGTLGFSPSPSISISNSIAYDKFVDTGSDPIYWYHEDN